MDFIEALGPARVSFEGVGILTASDSKEHEVSFHLVQAVDGALFLGVRGGGIFALEDAERFEGTTIGSGEQKIVSTDDLLQASGRAVTNLYHGAQALFLCNSVTVDTPARLKLLEILQEKGDSPPQVGGMRVALANYIGSTSQLDVGGIEATFDRVDNFVRIKEAFRVAGGVFHTHEVGLTGSLADIEADPLLESLCLALSLETGTRVNMYSVTRVYEGAHEQTLLRAPIVRRQARLPGLLGVLIEPQPLVDALLAGGLKRGRSAINQFVEACNEETFLEARGLNAVSLIDSLLQAFDERNRSSPRLSSTQQATLRREARRAATEAAASFDLHESERAAIGQNLRDNIVRIGESSFRRKLVFHLENQGIIVSRGELDDLAGRVTRTRNQLVHAAAFIEKGDQRYREYLRLVWVAAALTARWVGYDRGFGSVPATC